MDQKKLLAAVDHTLLRPDSTWEEIRALCDEAVRFGTASVCIPPSFVKRAKEYLGGKMPVCTVIGFPNGYSTAAVKVFETETAVADGADEIDMVINIGDLKAGNEAKVRDEIRAVRRVCPGRILKVIIETCLLTEAEKVAMCRIVTEAGADFIKTSTGFSAKGATFEDVSLFARHVGKAVRIKAAGGIESLRDAERFLELGAARLGTSRVVKLIRQQEEAAGEQKEACKSPAAGKTAAEQRPGCDEKIDGSPARTEAYAKIDGSPAGAEAYALPGEPVRRMLTRRALEVLRDAYAPYSRFHVAAALLCGDGAVYTGVNIENASYPAGTCAERTAFSKAVSEGRRDFRAIVICGGREGRVSDYCAPCGICRQFMREFAEPERFWVILARSEEDYRAYRLEELLPESFGPGSLV